MNISNLYWIDNKTTNADHMINKFSENENLDELYDK